MSQTLFLLPGIILALDEAALEYGRRWQQGLPSRGQKVFQVAGSWEEFLEILEDYRKSSFDEVILQAGLSTETQLKGRRVNVVVLASLTSKVPWEKWREVGEALTLLPLTLERHWVLLHHEQPKLTEPSGPGRVDFSGLPHLPSLPWLLTRITKENLTLGEEDFAERVERLLDALCLTEWEGGKAREHIVSAFFRPPANPGHLRLAGFPRLSLEEVSREMAEEVAQAVLTRAYKAYKRSYDEAHIRSFEKRVALQIEDFLAGRRTATQVEEDLLNYLSNLGRLPNLVAACKDLKGILEKERQRVQQEAVEPRPTPPWYIRLWRRLRAWWRGEAPPGRSGPDQSQREFVLGSLSRIRTVVEELEIRAQQGREITDIPQDPIRDWSDELQDLIRQALRKNWSVEEVLRQLSFKIRVRLQIGYFSRALSGWDLRLDRVQEVRKALEEGNLLRFSAPLKAGLPVRGQAVVTSLEFPPQVRHGDHQVQCATLRLWPGRPSLFVAASEDVPVERLNL